LEHIHNNFIKLRVSPGKVPKKLKKTLKKTWHVFSPFSRV
jgi:hypothetical protein